MTKENNIHISNYTYFKDNIKYRKNVIYHVELEKGSIRNKQKVEVTESPILNKIHSLESQLNLVLQAIFYISDNQISDAKICSHNRQIIKYINENQRYKDSKKINSLIYRIHKTLDERGISLTYVEKANNKSIEFLNVRKTESEKWKKISIINEARILKKIKEENERIFKEEMQRLEEEYRKNDIDILDEEEVSFFEEIE